MLIVCPNCATSYDIEVASLRPDGRRVRCVRCRAVWQAEIPHKEKLLAAAEALAPDRHAGEVTPEGADAPRPEQPALASAEADGLAFGEAASVEPAGQGPAPEATEASPQAVNETTSAEGPEAAEGATVQVESPPTVPSEPDDGRLPVGIETEPSASHDEEPEDIESVAARRYPRPGKHGRWQWPLSRLQSAMLALIVIDAIVVGWRGDFVRAMPQTASFYAWLGLPVNVRGLDFGRLTTSTEQHDGVPILVVGGKIINVTGKTETVPHLRFAVRNAARQEIYSWSAVPPRSVLTSGEAIAFQTRLASPPPDSHDVLVRFVNRYDILTGTH